MKNVILTTLFILPVYTHAATPGLGNGINSLQHQQTQIQLESLRNQIAELTSKLGAAEDCNAKGQMYNSTDNSCKKFVIDYINREVSLQERAASTGSRGFEANIPLKHFETIKRQDTAQIHVNVDSYSLCRSRIHENICNAGARTSDITINIEDPKIPFSEQVRLFYFRQARSVGSDEAGRRTEYTTYEFSTKIHYNPDTQKVSIEPANSNVPFNLSNLEITYTEPKVTAEPPQVDY